MGAKSSRAATEAELFDKPVLAELMANGATILEAAKRLGASRSYTYRVWDLIRADLGWQAA